MDGWGGGIAAKLCLPVNPPAPGDQPRAWREAEAVRLDTDGLSLDDPWMEGWHSCQAAFAGDAPVPGGQRHARREAEAWSIAAVVQLMIKQMLTPGPRGSFSACSGMLPATLDHLEDWNSG